MPCPRNTHTLSSRALLQKRSVGRHGNAPSFAHEWLRMRLTDVSMTWVLPRFHGQVS